jgi:hypothetical protein
VLQTTRLLHLVFYPASAVSRNQPTKVSSANLSLFLSYWYFISNRISGNGAAPNILTAANLTGTISAAVLGNSTFFYWYFTAVALNRASANQALTGILSIVFLISWYRNISSTAVSCWSDYTYYACNSGILITLVILVL